MNQRVYWAVKMKKPVVWVSLVLLAGLLLTACGSGDTSDQAQPSATLPPPQIRVEVLPSETPTPLPPTETQEPTPTITPIVEVVVWPTADLEEYYFDQFDSLSNDMLNRLDSQDTNP